MKHVSKRSLFYSFSLLDPDLSYERPGGMEGGDEEMSEEIKKSIRFELEFLKNRLIEATVFTDRLLSKVQQLTNSECEYEFDEYPDVYSEKIYDDGYGYVSYENAIDEIKCQNHEIYMK